MIKFERKGNKVQTIISTSIGWNFHFDYTCADEPYAIFLTKDMQTELWSTIAEIRKKAYQQGWSDKSRKKAKQGWFSGKIDVNAQF